MKKKRSVVAIIGRPNVGKSTLFNRIIRKREAIVDDQPGVTRDRKYETADWTGVAFDLVDTGGYVSGSEDVFEEAIRRQVHFALAEADAAVLVVDGITGVTDIDLDIARMLQKSKTPVLLAVNKIDNELRGYDLGEFYKLGLGEPIPVSAISGRMIGDFLDALVAQLPPGVVSPEAEDGAIKLAIIGKPNVGKSSLINALLGEEKHIVTDVPGTTRDAVDTRLRYQEQDFILIDTAGLRRKARVHEDVEYFSTVRTHNAIRRCDVSVVLFDASQSLSDQDKKIIEAAVEAGTGIVVAVNKWDLIEKDTLTAQAFRQNLTEAVHELSYIPILFISAMTHQRIFKVLDTSLLVYQELHRQIKTSDLNRFLQDAIAENHPPAYGDKWVKINYVTQLKIKPPLFSFFTNEPRGVPKNYRNYLENRFRAQFGFSGVPIRFVFRKKN
ncbi:MAG TPA: ribosome biogenesis GTPase Der [bacterium]|nr:ribosome biogenesis GTPase Der [bacterium]